MSPLCDSTRSQWLWLGPAQGKLYQGVPGPLEPFQPPLSCTAPPSTLQEHPALHEVGSRRSQPGIPAHTPQPISCWHLLPRAQKLEGTWALLRRLLPELKLPQHRLSQTSSLPNILPTALEERRSPRYPSAPPSGSGQAQLPRWHLSVIFDTK